MLIIIFTAYSNRQKLRSKGRTPEKNISTDCIGVSICIITYGSNVKLLRVRAQKDLWLGLAITLKLYYRITIVVQ